MRTLITTGIYPPDIGGPATFVPKLAKELELNGDIPIVVSLKPEDFKEELPTYPLYLVGRSKNRVFRLLMTFKTVLINAARADRIFSNGLYIEAGLSAFVFRKRAIAKLVGDPIWEKCRNQGLTSENILDFQHSKLGFKLKIMKLIYIWSLNQFDVIYCPSSELVGIFRMWGVTTEIKHIPNGVEIPEIELVEKKYDLVCVSRLVKWKNVDQCIRTASELGLSLLIIGTGPEMQNLRFLSNELSAKCTFAGDCTPSEVLDYLKVSRVYLLVSQYEGLSFSLLEAMSLCVPVVVSNALGNLAVVQNGLNGYVVEPTDLKAIIQAVSTLIGNPDLRLQLGLEARETVISHYNSKVRFAEVIELIRK